MLGLIQLPFQPKAQGSPVFLAGLHWTPQQQSSGKKSEVWMSCCVLPAALLQARRPDTYMHTLRNGCLISFPQPKLPFPWVPTSFPSV